ncbi:Lsr2 family protein [Arthrobacter sp. SW1]|uniref:histone-like nucleoid-structuring protein Lsr2 n=1 Tax=Arthrobacter sp. SW1 TaxID=1920889 RepID=UPI0009427A2B|nr:Lsr2 family protein [Arthrobacter sp. SW1]
MATITQKIDDLDGGIAVESVRIELDGAVFELDLSESNLETLRAVLAPYILKARRISRKKSGVTSSSAGFDRLVRQWAVANGHRVNRRGQVARHLKEAYLKAQSTD